MSPSWASLALTSPQEPSWVLSSHEPIGWAGAAATLPGRCEEPAARLALAARSHRPVSAFSDLNRIFRPLKYERSNNRVAWKITGVTLFWRSIPWISIYISICLSVCLSIHPSIHPQHSIHPNPYRMFGYICSTCSCHWTICLWRWPQDTRQRRSCGVIKKASVVIFGGSALHTYHMLMAKKRRSNMAHKISHNCIEAFNFWGIDM